MVQRVPRLVDDELAVLEVDVVEEDEVQDEVEDAVEEVIHAVVDNVDDVVEAEKLPEQS